MQLNILLGFGLSGRPAKAKWALFPLTFAPLPLTLKRINHEEASGTSDQAS